MSRKNRGRDRERDEDEDDDDADDARARAAAAGGNRIVAIGAAMLAVGFLAGYFVGSDQGSRGAAQPSAPFANAPFAQGMGAQGAAAPASAAGAAMAGGDLAPAVLPPPHKGHTFTGQINVPPHSEAAHELADTLIAGITCPCGGCQNMKLGECGCDTAKEIGGYAAHLLERGKHGDEVLKQLEPRYGFAVDDSLLARAKNIILGSAAAAEPPPASDLSANASGGAPAEGGMGALAALAGESASVQRLVDVPSSARPGAGTPGAISGTIDLAPALRAKMPASATLFIFAKPQQGGGPPMAVLREPIDGSTRFPIAFSLSQANVMMPGVTLAGSVWVTARIDVDGVAGAGPGDMEGVTPSAVDVGRNDVHVTIDTVR